MSEHRKDGSTTQEPRQPELITRTEFMRTMAILWLFVTLLFGMSLNPAAFWYKLLLFVIALVMTPAYSLTLLKRPGRREEPDPGA